MKQFIKDRIRTILESMPDEHLGTISMNIPFTSLILDRVNLEWAIENIKEKRPSRSKAKPMQVAMSYDRKYYLLDGYHRLVEAVLAGETSAKVMLLNKSYENLKKNNQIGVACNGGSGDEFCNNFKTLGSINMIKQSLNEQMIDGENMNQGTQTICNKLTIDSYQEAMSYVRKGLEGMDEMTKGKIMQKIHVPLENLRQEQNKIDSEIRNDGMSGDSMPDEADTYWAEIQTAFCDNGPEFE
jgi:hypothetical protein